MRCYCDEMDGIVVVIVIVLMMIIRETLYVTCGVVWLLVYFLCVQCGV
jgi:hypothetical protein